MKEYRVFDVGAPISIEEELNANAKQGFVLVEMIPPMNQRATATFIMERENDA